MLHAVGYSGLRGPGKVTSGIAEGAAYIKKAKFGDDKMGGAAVVTNK